MKSTRFEGIDYPQYPGWERVNLELTCEKNTDIDWELHTILSNLTHPLTLKGLAGVIVSSEISKCASALITELKENRVPIYCSY